MANEVEIHVSAHKDGDMNRIGQRIKQDFAAIGRDIEKQFGKVGDANNKSLIDSVRKIRTPIVGEYRIIGEQAGNALGAEMSRSFKGIEKELKGSGARSGREFTSGMASELRKSRMGLEDQFAALSRKAELEFRRAGRDSAVSFNEHFKRSGGDGFDSFMVSMALGSMRGFKSAVKKGLMQSPLIGEILLSTFMAAVLVVGPIIGAALAGGIVTALGAGLVGVFTYFAFLNKDIMKEFRKTKDEIIKDFEEISKPFQGVIRHALKWAEVLTEAFRVPLSEAAEFLAPMMKEFVTDLGIAFQELKPAIKPLSEAFGAILTELGPQLPGMFRELADGIIAVAESIKENPDTFVMIIKWLFELTNNILQIIAVLNDFAGWFEDHPNVTEPLVFALRAMFSPGYLVIGLINDIYDAVEGLTAKDWLVTLGWNISLNPVRIAFEWGRKWGRSIFKADLGFDLKIENPFQWAFRKGKEWGRKLFNAKLGFNLGGVFSGIRRAISAGLNWAKKTFTASLDFDVNPFGKASGGIIGAASGGARGGMTWVGEQGPELVRLPFGSTVIPSGQSKAMAAGASGGSNQPIVVKLYLDGKQVAESVFEHGRNIVRGEFGGNVQSALGNK